MAADMDENVSTYLDTLKQLIGDRDPIDILSLTPSRIRALIAGVGAGELSHNPAPGKWSIAEILAHLADSELVVGFRLRLMFATNGAHLQAFDPDRWAETF